jgi:hypothetical protein
MKKSDVLVADIIIYALKQIQMAKFDMSLKFYGVNFGRK